MRKVGSLSTLSVILGTAVLYQNCSKANLSRPEVVEIASVAKGNISICFVGAFSNYTLDIATVANLNLSRSGKGLAMDSDGDGLSDVQENQVGFNPTARRSNGILQDSICWNASGTSQCTSSLPICNSAQFNALGISDCDAKAQGLELIYSHPNQGIDTDKDGMLDIFEIRNGTSVVAADAVNDPDHDGILNQEELGSGRNPLHFDADTAIETLTLFHTAQVSNSDCNGESWQVTIDQIPLSQALAYQEASATGGLSFNHAADENLILITLKLKGRLGMITNSKVVFFSQLLNIKDPKPITAVLQNFTFAGEILP